MQRAQLSATLTRFGRKRWRLQSIGSQPRSCVKGSMLTRRRRYLQKKLRLSASLRSSRVRASSAEPTPQSESCSRSSIPSSSQSTRTSSWERWSEQWCTKRRRCEWWTRSCIPLRARLRRDRLQPRPPRARSSSKPRRSWSRRWWRSMHRAGTLSMASSCGTPIAGSRSLSPSSAAAAVPTTMTKRGETQRWWPSSVEVAEHSRSRSNRSHGLRIRSSSNLM
mmetsp:Transcript_30662/g.99718  ORF Transcript_30662/g.99718 Transcript_30662/m.99718 type:complete len:222 (-) Transcript_30662:884-1549(-)